MDCLHRNYSLNIKLLSVHIVRQNVFFCLWKYFIRVFLAGFIQTGFAHLSSKSLYTRAFSYCFTNRLMFSAVI